jgi:integrase
VLDDHLALGGSTAPRERHTVGEVVAGYIADGASRLSPGTLDFYRKGLAALPALPEVFRNRAVTEVTPFALDGVYGELRAEGASEHMLQKVHCLLSAAFNRAVRYGWVVANPCLQATKPKVDSDEIEPPPPAWVRQLIVEAEGVNDDLGVCLRLAAATGARRGELMAIRWVDFRDSRLTIRRSLVESEGQLLERRTKTGFERPPDDRGGRGDDASDRRAPGAAAGGRRRARAARTRRRVLPRCRRHAVAAGLPVARSPTRAVHRGPECCAD